MVRFQAQGSEARGSSRRPPPQGSRELSSHTRTHARTQRVHAKLGWPERKSGVCGGLGGHWQTDPFP